MKRIRNIGHDKNHEMTEIIKGNYANKIIPSK